MSAARAFAVLGALAALAFVTPSAHAISADPAPHEFVQPDGTRVTLFLKGDEFLHWRQDAAGHPVVLENGTWRYARLDADGALVATPLAVGAGSPEAFGSTIGLRPQPGAAGRAAQEASLKPVGEAQRTNTQPTGVVKNLVVLCLFSDQSIAAQGRDPAAYDSLFNSDVGGTFNDPTGSVKMFYSQASYGQLTLRSTVLAWVTLPHPESYYANNLYGLPFASGAKAASPYPNNASGMVHDALDILDASVNFADYDTNLDGYVDAIDFIHSGYGGEASGGTSNQIWSHKANLSGKQGGGVWTSADQNAAHVNVKVDLYHTEPARWGSSGSDLVRVGVIAHETGHFFGLPDLYDHNGNSAGLGNWCVMANAWGWDQSQHYPPIFSAWCKQQLGWVAPLDVTSPGTWSLGECETTPAILRTSIGMPAGEYLLVENREPVGFDQQIPRGGIAVYHVDDNVGGNDAPGFPGQAGWPGNGLHGEVTLLQADGLYDLEKNVNQGDGNDLYRASGISIANESTVPSTDSYTGLDSPTGDEVRVLTDDGASMNVALRPGYWVDFAAVGPEQGTFLFPFHSVATAVASALSDGGLVFKPGISHELPTLTKPLWFRSWNGTTTIGR